MYSLPSPRQYRRLYDEMAVDLPDGKHGSCEIRHFTIETGDFGNLRAAMDGRGTLPGAYTKLLRNGSLWMSDTTAERRDHSLAAHEIASRGGRVLIGGLGLGMILRVALFTPEVTHVDVVEIDPDVIALVGPSYLAMAAERGVTLTIHEYDLFTIKWPAGTRWDVAWFDVWGDVSTDVLDEMSKLRRSYGRRTDWNECWFRKDLLRQRRRDRQSSWW